MDKLQLNSYINKSLGDQISAADWNGVFKAIQDKINEIIDSQAPSTKESSLLINGVLHTENTITLDPAQDYKISGTLYGKLVINAATVTAPAANTNITFDGVTIISDEANAIVYTTPAENKGYKDLVITLTKDSLNIIVANYEQPRTDDQPGAIYSMNNMVILGEGYLAISNKGGHGVRATELKMAGAHIYTDVNHDAVHAGKYLEVSGCYIYCNNCNDVFGTGTAGKLYVFDTYIIKENMDGKYMKSGEQGCFSEVYVNGDTISSTNITNMADLHAVTADNFESVFGATATPSIVGFATKEEYDTNTNGQVISETGGTYNITTPYVKMSGLIENNISYNPADVVDLNIYLSGAFIKTPGNVPAINYIPADGKVKIATTKDTFNAIITTEETNELLPDAIESDCIKSENNIRIEVKNGSVLYVQSKAGDGIDGGEVKITDTKGSLVVCGCGLRGIKGNAVVIGPNANVSKSVITAIPDSTDEDGFYVNPEDADNYSDVQGVVVCNHNCTQVEISVVGADVKNTGMADIYCRNGKATKGVFGTTDSELKGVLLCGSIAAVVNINLNNATRLYYNNALTEVTKDCGKTAASSFAISTDKKEFPYFTL